MTWAKVTSDAAVVRLMVGFWHAVPNWRPEPPLSRTQDAVTLASSALGASTKMERSPENRKLRIR